MAPDSGAISVKLYTKASSSGRIKNTAARASAGPAKANPCQSVLRPVRREPTGALAGTAVTSRLRGRFAGWRRGSRAGFLHRGG